MYYPNRDNAEDGQSSIHRAYIGWDGLVSNLAMRSHSRRIAHRLVGGEVAPPKSGPMAFQSAPAPRDFDLATRPGHMLRPRLAIEMSINHRESMRQEQLYAPALLDILLLFGPWPLPLY